jgi:hypothetical protein
VPRSTAAQRWQHLQRKGLRDNPTKKHLEALSSFFGVPVAYFFDDEAAARIDAELALLSAIRDARVRQVALRASGLSTESLETIAEMIERVRKLEGLPEDPAELARGTRPAGGVAWIFEPWAAGASRRFVMLPCQAPFNAGAFTRPPKIMTTRWGEKGRSGVDVASLASRLRINR